MQIKNKFAYTKYYLYLCARFVCKAKTTNSEFIKIMTKKFFMFAAMLMAVAAVTFTACEKNNDPYAEEIKRVKAAAQGDWVGDLVNLVGDSKRVTVSFTESKVSTSEGVSANIVAWTCPDGKTWIELDDEQKSKVNIRVNGNNMELTGTTTFFFNNFPTMLTKKTAPSADEIVWDCETTTLQAPLTGGNLSFSLSCNQSWTASTNKDWITVTPTQGAANQSYTIQVTVAAGEKADGKIYFENAKFPDDYWFVIIERQ